MIYYTILRVCILLEDCVNDPRFMGNSVIAKRLAAFQTISVVSAVPLAMREPKGVLPKGGLHFFSPP